MILQRITWPLVEFLYPGRCAACDMPAESASRLCLTCDELIAGLERRPACRRCAAPSATVDAPCPRCNDRGMRPFETVAALGMFADPVRPLIHRIKYHHDWPIAETLTTRLANRPLVRRVLSRAEWIVPIPLHPFRQLLRGYNQADVIARRLCKFSSATLAHPLIRIRNTHTQTDVHNLADRVKNVRDAFRLRRPNLFFATRRVMSTLTGKHVVLVDDVMTTGATLRSAARALLPLKPASISAVVLAIADPRGRSFESI